MFITYLSQDLNNNKEIDNESTIRFLYYNLLKSVPLSSSIGFENNKKVEVLFFNKLYLPNIILRDSPPLFVVPLSVPYYTIRQTALPTMFRSHI